MITRRYPGSGLASLLLLMFFNKAALSSDPPYYQPPDFSGWLSIGIEHNSSGTGDSRQQPESVPADVHSRLCLKQETSHGVNRCGSNTSNLFHPRRMWFQSGLFPLSSQEKDPFRGGGDNPGKSERILSSEALANETGSFGSAPQVTQVPELPEVHKTLTVELFRNQNSSIIDKLKRAEALSLSSQIAGLVYLQSIDVWNTGSRPFSDWKNSLRRAWTTAPEWDDDHYKFNYIGHPYTGSFTYNLMRSQAASPLISWLFSCSQSLIWEFTIEAAEEHPSIQDLLITPNVGSLLGEGIHRLTQKMKKNGLSLPEKIIVTFINPGHILNNGYR